MPIDYGGVGLCGVHCLAAVCPTQSLLHFFSFACLAWECAIMYYAARMLVLDENESTMHVGWQVHALCWGSAVAVGLSFGIRCGIAPSEARMHNIMVSNLYG